MQLKQIHKKVLLSAVVLVIGVLSYTSLLDALFQKKFFKELDEKGNIYFDEAIKRAIYTFAIVRGINGVISVAQGTDIAVSPAGIGVQLAVGEALDPVNDLVERFSWVMLVSITSLGIQKNSHGDGNMVWLQNFTVFFHGDHIYWNLDVPIFKNKFGVRGL